MSILSDKFLNKFHQTFLKLWPFANLRDVGIQLIGVISRVPV